MVSEVIDLTEEPEFELEENPFLNDDEDSIIQIGHNYNLKCRINYKIQVIKGILNEIEHDIRLSQYNKDVGR